jgi:CheY-like chemotaxis protein
MTTKILIVDPDIKFTVPLKRALEQSGDHAVHVFVNGRAALDMLQREPHDIAIVDMGVEDLAPVELVRQMRSTQPGLFILASVRGNQHLSQQPDLAVQGSITKPYYARQVIPLIREAILARNAPPKVERDPRETLEVPTDDNPAIRQFLATMPGHTSSEFAEILPGLVEPPIQPDDTFRRLINQMRAGDTGKNRTIDALDAVIKKITSEHSAVEGGTSLDVSEEVSEVPQSYPDSSELTGEPPIPEGATIRQLVSGAPMPPDTLPEGMPENIPDVLDTQENAQTMPIAPQIDPPLAGGSAIDARIAVDIAMTTLGAAVDPAVPMEEVREVTQALTQSISQSMPAITGDTRATTEIPVQSSEPVASLAVQLTQINVESTAQITILSRGTVPVGAAGSSAIQLTPERVDSIVASINKLWGDSEEPVLMRYVHMPGLGDFLLWSTRTVDSLTLSMLFPGDVPYRAVKQQAKQLLEALARTPEPPPPLPVSMPEEEPEAAKTLHSRPTDLKPPEGLHEALADIAAEQMAQNPQIAPPRIEGPYTAYDVAWLPRMESIPYELLQIIPDAITQIAWARSWQIDAIDVHESYVSLRISIPASEAPSPAIDTLMQESALRVDVPDLWSDAYFIVQASEDGMTEQEIAEFIDFQREGSQHGG